MKTTVSIPISYEVDLDELPEWANWIAVNKSGSIWAFEHKPATISNSDLWYCADPDDELKILLDSNYNNIFNYDCIEVLDWRLLAFEIEKLNFSSKGRPLIQFNYKIDLSKLPEWTTWIAIDRNGAIWLYGSEPMIKLSHPTFWCIKSFGKDIFLNPPHVVEPLEHVPLLNIENGFFYVPLYLTVQDWEQKKFKVNDLKGLTIDLSTATDNPETIFDYQKNQYNILNATIFQLKEDLANEKDQNNTLKKYIVGLEKKNNLLTKVNETLESAMAEMEKDIMNLYNELGD